MAGEEKVVFFFFSSRRRHTRSKRDWSSDVCSSDLAAGDQVFGEVRREQPRVRCRSQEACLVEFEGGDRRCQGIKRREDVVDRVEDRGLVLLEISVVALGQAL